jgi:serine/threonine protein kinase
MTIGEKVRGYRLLERVGHDGPWTAYLAVADRTDSEILLKTLTCERVNKRAFKRLTRGFRFPHDLAVHPCVVPVLDIGATTAGRPYVVTELLDGSTLAEWRSRGVPTPLGETLSVAKAVASALAATHAAESIHGDVRPEHVVLPTGGEPMLTGFATASLMSLAQLPDGTSASVHTAPEVFMGRAASPASDVYALGSMLYELLTGSPAYSKDGPETTAEFVLAVLSTEPRPLTRHDLPPGLGEAVAWAMAKDPETRPTSAALAAALFDVDNRVRRLPLTDPATQCLKPGDQLTGDTRGDKGRQAWRSLPSDVWVAGTRSAELESARPAASDEATTQLVWAVNSQEPVTPPPLPEPYHHPEVVTRQPQQTARHERRTLLFIGGIGALVVLIGVGSIAAAMNSGMTPIGHRQDAAIIDPTEGAGHLQDDQSQGTVGKTSSPSILPLSRLTVRQI